MTPPRPVVPGQGLWPRAQGPRQAACRSGARTAGDGASLAGAPSLHGVTRGCRPRPAQRKGERRGLAWSPFPGSPFPRLRLLCADPAPPETPRRVRAHGATRLGHAVQARSARVCVRGPLAVSEDTRLKTDVKGAISASSPQPSPAERPRAPPTARVSLGPARCPLSSADLHVLHAASKRFFKGEITWNGRGRVAGAPRPQGRAPRVGARAAGPAGHALPPDAPTDQPGPQALRGRSRTPHPRVMCRVPTAPRQ